MNTSVGFKCREWKEICPNLFYGDDLVRYSPDITLIAYNLLSNNCRRGEILLKSPFWIKSDKISTYLSAYVLTCLPIYLGRNFQWTWLTHILALSKAETIITGVWSFVKTEQITKLQLHVFTREDKPILWLLLSFTKCSDNSDYCLSLTQDSNLMFQVSIGPNPVLEF